MQSEPLRKAVSADGKLTFGVFAEEDYYLGFEGHAWHTHGDLLVPEYGVEPKTAALAFFDSVVQDRQVICVSKRKDMKEEVWIIDDVDGASRYMEEGEHLQLRFWSGKEIARHEKKANHASQPTRFARD